MGRLRSSVERLLADPGTLAAATRLLLEQHFTPVLAELICAAVDLDVAALDLAGDEKTTQTVRSRPRRRGFAEEVLRAYAYQCAMCGFDGALGRYPVGIEAAHVRWHSQDGPDETPNALALCALHHALFDLGVVGITEDRRICVSSLYVARNEAGRAVGRKPPEEHPPGLPRDHQFRPAGLPAADRAVGSLLLLVSLAKARVPRIRGSCRVAGPRSIGGLVTRPCGRSGWRGIRLASGRPDFARKVRNG